MIDFVESENSMGFHAPQEAARITAMSIDYSRKGQSSLRASLAALPEEERPQAEEIQQGYDGE